jgi:hypothetical protein
MSRHGEELQVALALVGSAARNYIELSSKMWHASTFDVFVRSEVVPRQISGASLQGLRVYLRTDMVHAGRQERGRVENWFHHQY